MSLPSLCWEPHPDRPGMHHTDCRPHRIVKTPSSLPDPAQKRTPKSFMNQVAGGALRGLHFHEPPEAARLRLPQTRWLFRDSVVLKCFNRKVETQSLKAQGWWLKSGIARSSEGGRITAYPSGFCIPVPFLAAWVGTPTGAVEYLAFCAGLVKPRQTDELLLWACLALC